MKDIYAHIEKHLEESIQVLMDLVRQPSVSAQNVGFDKAPQLVKAALERVGLKVDIVPVPNGGKPAVFGWANASATTSGPRTRHAHRSTGSKAPTLLFYTLTTILRASTTHHTRSTHLTRTSL